MALNLFQTFFLFFILLESILLNVLVYADPNSDLCENHEATCVIVILNGPHSYGTASPHNPRLQEQFIGFGQDQNYLYYLFKDDSEVDFVCSVPEKSNYDKRSGIVTFKGGVGKVTFAPPGRTATFIFNWRSAGYVYGTTMKRDILEVHCKPFP